MKIGIDGGGTKTAFILVDEDGKVVVERSAAGCNPSLLSREEILSLLRPPLVEFSQIARQSEKPISHTVLCMAGSPLFWSDLAGQLEGLGTVQALQDSIPVLELATGGNPGLVLHVGTGSFVAARSNDGHTHYAGGLGWRLGDPGSAHDLGRRAVTRAILEAQGWATPSMMGQAIHERVGHKEARSLTRHFYQEDSTPHNLAVLAPVLTAAAENGDPAARGILRDSITDLVGLAHPVIARLFAGAQSDEIPLGLSGPILHTSIARQAIAASLGDDWDWRVITEPPIAGVRRLLAKL